MEYYAEIILYFDSLLLLTKGKNNDKPETLYQFIVIKIWNRIKEKENFPVSRVFILHTG